MDSNNEKTEIDKIIDNEELLKKTENSLQKNNEKSLLFKALCFISLGWSCLSIIIFLIGYFYLLKIVNHSTFLIGITSALILIFIICNLSIVIGVYKMYKSQKNGYKYFFNGNITLIIFLLMSILGNINSPNNNGFAIVLFIVSIIFGVAFKAINKEI